MNQEMIQLNASASLANFQYQDMDAGEYYAECMAHGRIREVVPALLDAAGYVKGSDYEKMKDDADRGAEMIRSCSAGGKARSSIYQESYVKAREFLKQYHLDHPNISFCQARRKAAQYVDVSESTLKNNIKKAEFPDW